MGKEVPVGVKIISVLGYIGAVLVLLLGIGMIAGAGFIASFLEGLAILGAGLFVGLGIVLIALAVLGFFMARGLWKGQNWARILTIIFSGIGFLQALIALIQGNFGSIVTLVIDGIIAYYLWFNADVKKAFS